MLAINEKGPLMRLLNMNRGVKTKRTENRLLNMGADGCTTPYFLSKIVCQKWSNDQRIMSLSC